MMTLNAYIRQENISLYKKLLADRNISDGQREVIGKLLAEEEARLLDLLNNSSANAGSEVHCGRDIVPIAQNPLVSAPGLSQ